MNWGGAITLGGAVLGLAILGHHLAMWWPGVGALRKDPLGCLGELTPFVLAWLYGTALLMCALPIFRFLTDLTVWSVSWLGDGALVWGVGGQAGQGVGPADVQFLTNGGHAMVLIVGAVLLGLLKVGRINPAALRKGTFCGVLLGQTGGVLGLAAPVVATSFNLSGAWLSTGVL